MMSKQLTKRSDVPVELTWDLTDLFATESAWEAELQAVQDDLHTVTQFKGKLGEGSNQLLDCLNAYEVLVHEAAKVADRNGKTFKESREVLTRDLMSLDG